MRPTRPFSTARSERSKALNLRAFSQGADAQVYQQHLQDHLRTGPSSCVLPSVSRVGPEIFIPTTMHQRTTDFVKFLASYNERDKPVVAREIAVIFIEEGNVDEVLSVLAAVSPQIKNDFLDRVAQAPSPESEWNQLQIIGAEMSEADCIRAKITWRLCVERVRRAMTQSKS